MTDERGSYFNERYYDWMNERSLRSAEVIVPMVRDLFRVGSVVDVGCGEGAWLSVYLKSGVREVMGLDGAHVDRRRLRVPAECFRASDLNAPPALERRFDLAQSLEVAHYLPAESAERFVAFLTGLAPVVLFSAGVPGQAGSLHRNEQWPSYWIGLFARRGYVALDPVRPRVWHDERVALYYRQNALLFAAEESLRQPGNERLQAAERANCLTLVDEDVIRTSLGWRASLSRWAARLFGGRNAS